MTRRPKTTAFWLDRLPHWEVEDGRYFITIHLAGAIPAVGRERLRTLTEQSRPVTRKDSPEWIALFSVPFFVKWSGGLIGRSGIPSSEIVKSLRWWSRPSIIVASTGDWHLFEYVVMPTHLHLFGEIGSAGMKETLNDFKRWTGHEAGSLLPETASRSGSTNGSITGRDRMRKTKRSPSTFETTR